jgi:UDP-N-acetylglucosamine--N-acetylmuramyl-(pentapeptide) pyrophosphoryl-undecaprenol N-acetylglucosamine transferase
VVAGAAVLIPDAELDGARLVREIEPMLEAPGILERMSQGARALARPDAASRVAALMEQVARA